MKQRIVLALLTVCLAIGAWANDGVYYVRGNQLVPIHEADISVEKEVLTISLCDDGYAQVDVQYEFQNHGAAKIVDMGFEASKPYNTEDSINPLGVHPYIERFVVEMNGEPLNYLNAVVEPGKFDVPFQEPEDEDEREFAPYSYVYYFKAPFRAGLNRVHHTYRYRMSYGVGRTFEVPYWLTPASRWKGGRISDFTLRICATNTAKNFLLADSVFAGSQFRITEGVGKIRQIKYWNDRFVEIALRNGVVEWHMENFLPKDDFYIQSADTYTSFNHSEIGSFYDRSDTYIFWALEGAEVPEQIARNLPYAHRGYVFKKKSLQKYFSKFWWYMPDPFYQPSMDDFTPREMRLIRERR
jgi:hypothetical protein